MPESDPIPQRRRSRKFIVVSATLIGVAIAGWFLKNRTALPPGLSRGEYDSAAAKFGDLYHRRPNRLDVLSLAGEMAVEDGRLATAAACFDVIPTADRKYGASARLQAGQVLLRLNRAGEAERNLREFLSLAARTRSESAEHVVAARKWLCYILSVELRLEERKTILAELHAAGQAGLFDSKQYYFPHLLLWHSSTGRRRLPELLDQDPQNPRLREAEGRYLTSEGRLDEARAWLEELYSESPHDLDRAAALLELLFECDDWDRFTAVASSLPDYEFGEPWLLTRMRSELALHAGQWDQAVVHWQQLLEVDPASPWAHVGLARAYAELQRPQDCDEEQRRSLVLSRIRVGLVNVKEDDYSAVLALASQCEQIEFHAAAAAFRRHASRIQQAHERPLPH